MATSAPPVDRRTALDISKQVQDLLTKHYARTWQEVDPHTGKPVGISAALIGIFARYSELIIQRLNKAPEKNFLAFLDLLGAALLPPQPARAPLTFALAPGSTVDAVAPAGTQVAAPLAEGEKEPVIFETERELVVTAAQLASLFVRDPQQDIYADQSTNITGAAPTGFLLFRGNQPLEHTLYLGHDTLLGLPQIQKLKISFTVDKVLGDNGAVEWQRWNGNQWQTLPVRGGPEQLNMLGVTMLDFGAIDPIPSSVVNGSVNRWLRCRLLTPVTPLAQAQPKMARANQLPILNNVEFQVSSKRTDLDVESALLNQAPLDTSKDFYPFGERPKFGDTLYLAHAELFGQPNAAITLTITLRNPAGGIDSGIKPTRTNGNPTLKWEIGDGKQWHELGMAESNKDGVNDATGFKDTTRAFTESGEVTLQLPAQLLEASTVAGQRNFWLRVRLDSGNYGVEGSYKSTDGGQSYKFTEATFAPPLIQTLKLTQELLVNAAPQQILSYNDFTYTAHTANQAFAPFATSDDQKPTAYLGFSLPPTRTAFPNRTLTLFARGVDFKYGDTPAPVWPLQSKLIGKPDTTVNHRLRITNPDAAPVSFQCAVSGAQWTTTAPALVDLSAGATKEIQVQVNIPRALPTGSSDRGFLRLTRRPAPNGEAGNVPSTLAVDTATFVTFVGAEPETAPQLQLVWEYWNGQTWARLAVRDETQHLTQMGLLQFLAPADFTSRSLFGAARYWLRVRWESGEFEQEPRLQRLLLNTTLAAQTVTIRNEILGSSDGNERLRLRTTRTPVLAGQQLYVRESELPSVEEQAILQREEGEQALAITSDAGGRPKEIWVRWHETPDFYASGPRDRHYVLDHTTGEIRFGDGLNGLIPPAGSSNLRMAVYRTGGGVTGNRPTNTLIQLKTTVPYVNKVTNPEAATGGANAETLDSLLERAPRTIRHRERAVTQEDYEDLARLASPAVARAKCVPLYDLRVDPSATQRKPGAVSLIIVPRTDAPKPLPSLELIGRVQAYLQAHHLPNVVLTVVGPEYIRVDVEVEIALTTLEGAREIEFAVQQTLARFLHPLTGGLPLAGASSGPGWGFGRKPHRSDLYALLEGVASVDHIRLLKVTEHEDRAGVGKSDRFLVYSGAHQIRLTYTQ